MVRFENRVGSRDALFKHYDLIQRLRENVKKVRDMKKQEENYRKVAFFCKRPRDLYSENTTGRILITAS